MDFTQYRRSQIAELRPYEPGENMERISISAPDQEAGSPKPGDMIARNPANHDDQWLVSADYFAANFEPLDAPAAPAGNFYDRLLNERRELDERLSALTSFLANNPDAPNPTQRKLLNEQKKHMGEYLAVLDQRILEIQQSRRSEGADIDAPEFNGANQ